MKVLVTGATGFLGAALLAELRTRDAQITCLLPDGLRAPDGVQRARGDLGRKIAPIQEPSATVFHLAGLAHFRARTDTERERFYEINDRGTGRLLDALGEASPRAIVHVSTVAVYGVESGESLTESTPAIARDAYGESKRRAEDRVRDYGARRNVPVLIVRLPLVVGPDAPGNFGALVRAIRRGTYATVGDGRARRSMVHRDDVARFLVDSAGRSGTYHVTDGDHPTVHDLAAGLARAVGKRSPPHVPRRAVLAAAGAVELGFRLARRVPPLDRARVAKLTSTLTFDDRRAREELGLRTTPVLERLDQLVGAAAGAQTVLEGRAPAVTADHAAGVTDATRAASRRTFVGRRAHDDSRESLS